MQTFKGLRISSGWDCSDSERRRAYATGSRGGPARSALQMRAHGPRQLVVRHRKARTTPDHMALGLTRISDYDPMMGSDPFRRQQHDIGRSAAFHDLRTAIWLRGEWLCERGTCGASLHAGYL